MQKITPFLWFATQAEEAVAYYLAIFKDSQRDEVRYYPPPSPGAARQVMSVSFSVAGQALIAFNGGPRFVFTEAISLFVDCETQTEVDALWEHLAEGGQKGRCGWLKDKFGVSWQIIPKTLGTLLQDEDRARAKRVLDAMMKMDKIDVQLLQEAAQNGATPG